MKATPDRIVAEGGTLPPIVEELLAKGYDSFYKKTDDGQTAYLIYGYEYKIMDIR
ncbi:hypothetical protein [Desulfosporosinus orientis]|uniref:hypothetical protein n=1 Tax=Desulfosporosinus orientis TaxID=1563 RepID=UPI0003138877|nr:hypothetical protein [Desulfosporosinus orientis]